MRDAARTTPTKSLPDPAASVGRAHSIQAISLFTWRPTCIRAALARGGDTAIPLNCPALVNLFGSEVCGVQLVPVDIGAGKFGLDLLGVMDAGDDSVAGMSGQAA